ncbi:hypothetical protein FOA52_005849 [Chlamydomonas sp. UWO 241]|nr:hypothetical protein FOA52_005849 [Chlamydomonas sp. UWO 241]
MPELCFIGMGAGIPTATLDGIRSCRHSHALRQPLADKMHSSSPEGTAQTLLELGFSNPADNRVTILNTNQGWWYEKATPAVCLSVDSGSHPCGSHLARGIIKTTAQLVYYCTTCDVRGAKKTCAHLKGLDTWLNQEDGLFWCNELAPFRLASAAPTQAPLDGEPESAHHPSVSTRPVSFNVYNDATMERQRHTAKPGLKPWCEQCLAPDADVDGRRCRHCIDPRPTTPCAICAEDSWHSVASKRKAVLTSMAYSEEVIMYSWKCVCGHKVPYDGFADGVFNQTNQSLWLHECLLDFWLLVSVAGLTFTSFVKMMVQKHVMAHCKQRLPSKTVMMAALWSFLNLLDVDYDVGGCPMCDKLAHELQVLVGDGVSVGNRTDTALPPDTPPDLPPTVVPELILHRADITIPGPFDRILSDACSDYPTFTMFNASDIDGDNADTTLLMSSVTAAQQNVMGPGQNLRTTFPLLHKLVNSCMWTQLPPAVADWVAHLQVQARQVVAADLSGIQDPDPNLLDYQKQRVHAPCHPMIRPPQKYGADDGSSAAADDMRDELPCTKHKLSHAGLTPGLFILFCAHGFMQIYSIMDRCEGPKTLFDLLYHRMEKAPKMLVYDNDCNACRSFMRRQPAFFAPMRFMIDRMHAFGHVACHSGFRLSSMCEEEELLPEWTSPDGKLHMPAVTVGKLNSQAAEQFNSRLRRIRTQAAYMRQSNFMKYARFVFYCLNQDMLVKYKTKQLAATHGTGAADVGGGEGGGEGITPQDLVSLQDCNVNSRDPF